MGLTHTHPEKWLLEEKEKKILTTYYRPQIAHKCERNGMLQKTFEFGGWASLRLIEQERVPRESEHLSP